MDTKTAVSEQYRPISAWGYVGYNLLFCIPIVGFILLIVFSFSNKNINRRNLARSYWCILLIAVIICVVLTLCFGVDLLKAVDQASRSVQH